MSGKQDGDETVRRLSSTTDLVSMFIIKRVMEYPGFLEWRRAKMNKVLSWGELPGAGAGGELLCDFAFDDHFLRHYEAVHSWVRLFTTTTAAKDCQFYFRRYPFRGLPVTRESHLRYSCEMWFSRIYECKERLKVCLNSLNAALPGPSWTLAPSSRRLRKTSTARSRLAIRSIIISRSKIRCWRRSV